MVISTSYRLSEQIPRVVIPSSHPRTYGRILYEMPVTFKWFTISLILDTRSCTYLWQLVADAARNSSLYDAVIYRCFKMGFLTAQVHMRPIQKVFSHFENLENQLHGHNVTWQPVSGNLIAHP
jgi:hypothetical protein